MFNIRPRPLHTGVAQMSSGSRHHGRPQVATVVNHLRLRLRGLLQRSHGTGMTMPDIVTGHTDKAVGLSVAVAFSYYYCWK